ncbi:MAG: MFS transporter [Pseudomonadota bacterium]
MTDDALDRPIDTGPATADRKRATLVLAPALIAFSMGQTVLFAVAGPVMRDIGLTEFQLGMIVSAAALTFVLVSPIWGGLSDRLGRKTVIVFGLLTYGMTSLAFAGAMDVGLRGLLGAGTVFVSLLVIRVLYAVLGAGIQPASIALMADLSEEDDRSSAVAIVGAAYGLGMILGPASAAALVGFGVLTPLYAIAVLGLICMVNAAIFLKSPAPTRAEEAASAPLDYGRLAPILVMAIALFSGVSGLQQTIAFYVQDYLGADSARAAQMTSLCFVAMATASLLVQGGLIQMLKPGPGLLLRVGIPTMLIGIMLYAFPLGFWQLVVASTVIGAGFGMANPGIIAAASLRAGRQSQGAAAGLTQAMMAAGYVVGPLAGTAAYEVSPTYSALFVGACALFACVIALGISHREAPLPAS